MSNHCTSEGSSCPLPKGGSAGTEQAVSHESSELVVPLFLVVGQFLAGVIQSFTTMLVEPKFFGHH